MFSGLPSYTICSKGGILVSSSCYCGWKKKFKFFPGSPHCCLLTSHQADWVPCLSWRSWWIAMRWAELLKPIRAASRDEEEVTSPAREGVSAQERAALHTKIWVLFLGEDGEVEAGESSAKMVSIPIKLYYCSAAQSCPTLCNAMDCSTPGFMSIELVMPSNHLIFRCPLLLLLSIFPSIKVFSIELVLSLRWPKYWSFSFSISPSNEHSGLISFRIHCFDLLALQGTLKSLLQYHSSKASILQRSAFLIVQHSHP